MDNVFSNPALMNKVRAELIAVAGSNESYCDPMFGSLFTDIVISTHQIVPRYSCQGHLSLVKVNDEGETEIVKKDVSYEDSVTTNKFLLSIDADPDLRYMVTNPYIYFLCTKKGKRILDEIFDILIVKAKREGVPLHIFSLTVDYYDEPSEPLIEHTGRVTLTIDGNWVFDSPDRQQKIIDMIRQSITQTLMFVLE